MFKFIFRTILLVFILIVLIIAAAFWKGGEPFRFAGEVVIVIGESVKKFGDTVDEIKRGGEKVSKQAVEMKETFDSLRRIKLKEEGPAKKDATINKSKQAE